MAISCKAIDEKKIFVQFPNQYRVGFQKIPTFFPEQFVRVIHPLQPHVQLTYRNPKYLFGKISTSLTNSSSIERTKRIFNTRYALSK